MGLAQASRECVGCGCDELLQLHAAWRGQGARDLVEREHERRAVAGALDARLGERGAHRTRGFLAAREAMAPRVFGIPCFGGLDGALGVYEACVGTARAPVLNRGRMALQAYVAARL